MRFKITILFLFLGLFASAQFHSPYYHASVVDSLILKHRGDTLFHVRLSHNKDTLFINNSYFVGGGGSSLDTTWTDNGFASKKQTSKRDTVQSEVFYTPFDGGGSMYKIGNYGYLQQSDDKAITLANDNLTSSLFLGEKEISLLTNGLSQQGYVQIDSSHVILYTQGKAAELDSNSFFPNINESLYNINLGKNLYPWDSIFSKHLQLQNLSGSVSVLGIDINGNVIKTSVGDYDSIWTEDLTLGHHWLYLRRLNDSVGIGLSQPTSKLDVNGEIKATVNSGDAINATSITGIGVYANAPDNVGIWGASYNGSGVYGSSTNSYGVYGNSYASDGVKGISITGFAGEFIGLTKMDSVIITHVKLRTGLDTIMVINHDSLYKELLPVITPVDSIPWIHNATEKHTYLRNPTDSLMLPYSNFFPNSGGALLSRHNSNQYGELILSSNAGLGVLGSYYGGNHSTITEWCNPSIHNIVFEVQSNSGTGQYTVEYNSFYPNSNASLGTSSSPWDRLFADTAIRFRGLPSIKKSKQLYIDPSTGYLSIGDTVKGGGATLTANLPLSITGSVISLDTANSKTGAATQFDLSKKANISTADTTWTDNGFSNKKQTSKRDTIIIPKAINFSNSSGHINFMNGGTLISRNSPTNFSELLLVGSAGQATLEAGSGSSFGGAGTIGYSMTPGNMSSSWTYVCPQWPQFGYQLDEWGFYPTGYSASVIANQRLGWPNPWRGLYIDSLAFFRYMPTDLNHDSIWMVKNNQFYKAPYPSVGTTYTAGYGLGLSGTTFYNSRYWGLQDSLKTSLSGLVLATAGKLTAITNSSSNWDAGYAYRLIGATGSSPLTLGLSGNALTGSIDTTTAKTGVANLYQLSLKQNKLATSADTSKFAWHDLTMHKLYYSNIQGTPFTWSSDYGAWQSSNTFIFNNPVTLFNGLTVHGTQTWDATYAASSFDSIIGLTSGTVGRMKWYLPFYAKDTNTQGNPITLKYSYTHYQPIGSYGTGSVTNITMGYGLSSTQSPLTTTGTMKVDSTVLVSTVRLGHLTSYPTLNQSTTGSAGSVANALSNGYGINSLTYNGSSALSIVVDTSHIWSSVRAGHLTAYPTFNQSTTGSAGSVGHTLGNGYGITSLSFNGSATGTVIADTSVLWSTVRAGHLTAYPTLNQSTTGNAATATRVGQTLGNGYGITSLSFNGSATGTVIADTSVLVSTVRHGHITSYPTLNQSTTGQAGSVAGTLSNGYGINTLSFNGSGSTTVVADSSHLISTVRFSHLTAFPTLNQSTTGQAGSVANALTNGYGLNTFTYNGSGAISPVVDTTHIISTVRFGHLTAFPTLNQNTSGSSGSCTGNSVTATTAGNISLAASAGNVLKYITGAWRAWPDTVGGGVDTTTGVGLKLETKYHSTVTYTAKSKIIMLFPSQFVDTSALISAGKVLLGYSVNITIDTLIIILNRRAGTPSITPNVYFGTDWTAAGTSIITSPSAVTSYTTVTKIYGAALQNTAISAGNQIWGKWTLTVAPKELYFILLGHYN